jgi:hypothetical protein
MRRCARGKRSLTDKLGGTVEAYGVGNNRNPSARTPVHEKRAGVDEADVHRSIRRVRLGPRAVVRAATNLGGDAGDKTPLTLVDLHSLHPCQRELPVDGEREVCPCAA